MILEDGLTVGGRALRDIFEAVDYAKAYDYMFSLMQSRRIDEQAVLHMHELFYQNIDPAYAGRYRDGSSLPAPVIRPQRRRSWMGK